MGSRQESDELGCLPPLYADQAHIQETVPHTLVWVFLPQFNTTPHVRTWKLTGVPRCLSQSPDSIQPKSNTDHRSLPCSWVGMTTNIVKKAVLPKQSRDSLKSSPKYHCHSSQKQTKNNLERQKTSDSQRNIK